MEYQDNSKNKKMESIWATTPEMAGKENYSYEDTSFVVRPTLMYSLLSPSKYFWLAMLAFFLWRSANGMGYPYFFLLTFAILMARYLYKVLYLRTTTYRIFDEQIVHTRGIFSIRKDFLELYRIKDFHEYRSLPMRLIGAMRVNLKTSDKFNRDMVLEGIPKSDLVFHLRSKVERLRIQKGVFEVD